jgi:hypothetical protein
VVQLVVEVFTAALIRARWLNACGKLPSWSPPPLVCPSARSRSQAANPSASSVKPRPSRP